MIRAPIRANLVDRLVTYFAPKRGRERFAARLMLFGAGGYTGARTDRAALKEWDPRIDSADSASIPDLKRLRARSRDSVRNHPTASAAIGVTVANAVGPGLYPVPTPDADHLGLTPEQVAEWTALVTRLWWHFAGKSRACDIAGRLNHGQQQRLVLRSQLESGDVFAIRRFQERRGHLFGLKVQIVEADRVCTPVGESNNDRIVDGIETDEDGQPVALHVLDRHPGEFHTGQATSKRIPVRGGASGGQKVVHLYDPLRPGQTRGVPILAAALERLKQMDRGVNAELMAQVVAGMIVYSVETETGEAVPSMDHAFVGETDGSTAEEQLKMDYGAVLGLRTGEKLNMHSSERPGSTFEPFQLHVAREVGASVGVPAGVMLHWFSKAYSASRGEWMLAWKHWDVRRDTVAYDFSAEVYAWMVEEAVARGYIDAPGFFDDPLAREAWLACEWRGSPPGQLDPLKEIQAIEKRRTLQISTLAQDTAEVTGGDWRANLRQLAAEKELAAALGLTAAPSPAPPDPPASADDELEDEDEDELAEEEADEE